MPRQPAAVVRARAALCALFIVLSACASGRSTFVPPSRPAEFSMTGIPWGISPDSMEAAMEARGYNLNKVDGDGDLMFDGVLNRTATRVFAFMSQQKLVKIRMVMLTKDEDAFTAYNRARAELTRQFGQPKETIEEYVAPYTKGDGKQVKAFKAGKGTMRTDWLPGTRTAHVKVEIMDPLVVVVDYEGNAWEKESLRRRQGSR